MLKELLSGFLLFSFIANPVLAQGADDNNSNANLSEKKSVKEQMKDVAAYIKNNPNDMDAVFKYAKLAESNGQKKLAVAAYLHMLEINPNLDRVKLDLALLYVKMEKFEEAKSLFNEVLAKNPPEAVKNNINQVIQVVDKAMQRNSFSGNITTGVNYSTNANSAAQSGELTFNDTNIALSGTSQSTKDFQYYGVTSLAHNFKIIRNEDYNLSLSSSFMYYRADQNDVKELDVKMVQVKTGPVLNLKNYNFTINPNFSFTSISLADEEYMHIRTGELNLIYAYNDRLSFNARAAYEDRNFMNSSTNQTYTERTGSAYEEGFGFNYILTDKDMFSVGFKVRNEEAAAVYYDNFQKSVTFNYIRILPYDITANLTTGFRSSNYNGADPLVSSTLIRNERERIAGVAFAKKLPLDFSISVGYQYKNVGSNIQNYDYTDHKITTGVSKSF